jgi:carbon monoxide dehydrogenase subunit G
VIIEEQFEVSAPRDDVVAYLLDVENMSRCVPGVEDMRPTGNNAYEASLRVTVGPIKTVFRGTAETNPCGVPEEMRGYASGRDRQSGSRVSVDFVTEFTEIEPGRTRVAVRADATVRGRLGQFGTGVIQATATELVRDFARCVETTLATRTAASAGEATDQARTAPRTSHASLRVVPVLGRALLRTISAWSRKLWARLRATRAIRDGQK